MPHMDGLGVLEKLHNENLENIPKIIILSAVGQDKITQRAIALGADYYIVKPFDLDVFVKRVRELAANEFADSDFSLSTSQLTNTNLQNTKNIIWKLKLPISYTRLVCPHTLKDINT